MIILYIMISKQYFWNFSTGHHIVNFAVAQYRDGTEFVVVMILWKSFVNLCFLQSTKVLLPLFIMLKVDAVLIQSLFVENRSKVTEFISDLYYSIND